MASIFLFLLATSVSARAFELQTKCPTTTERWDPGSLSCQDCPAERVTTTPLDEVCHCKDGFHRTGGSDHDLQIFDCKSCANWTAPQRRGFGKCLRCTLGAVYSDSEKDCRCPDSRHYLVETNNTKACLLCPPNTRVFSDRYTCQSCPSPAMTMSETGICSCPQNYIKSGSSCYLALHWDRLFTDFPRISGSQFLYKIRKSDGGESQTVTVNSEKAAELYATNAAGCNILQNATACQVLANLCVLNLHSERTTACQAFKAAKARTSGFTNMILDWGKRQPLIFYSSDDVLNDASALKVKISLYKGSNGSGHAEELSFLLVKWSMDGKLLGTEALTDQLQNCGGRTNSMIKFLRVGYTYENECHIHLDHLVKLAAKQGTFFYDMYIKDEHNMYYPVPIMVMTQDDNQIDTKEPSLFGRFFLYNTQSLNQSGSSDTILTYARKILLRMTISETSSQFTKIYPPTLNILYASRRVSDISNGFYSYDTLSFSSTWTIPQSSFWNGVIAAFVTTIAISIARWSLYVFIWLRRNIARQVGTGFAIRVVAQACGFFADSFFWLCFFVTVYLWLAFKEQAYLNTALPPIDSSEISALKGILIFSFFGKLFQVALKISDQIHVDIFFIDWEKPRVTMGVSGSEKNPISAWRKVFVANEWNSLSTSRMINVEITLLLILFFLQAVGLEALATAQPVSSDMDITSSPMHPALRHAVTTFFWLLIGGGQFVWRRLVYHRYFKDKATELVDILSLANVSVFLLDEEFHGWYLHGETIHQNADVSLEEMNMNIEGERINMCKSRGLVQDVSDPNSGQEAFEIFIPPKFRFRYDQIYRSVLNKVVSDLGKPAINQDHTRLNRFSQMQIPNFPSNNMGPQIQMHQHPNFGQQGIEQGQGFGFKPQPAIGLHQSDASLHNNQQNERSPLQAIRTNSRIHEASDQLRQFLANFIRQTQREFDWEIEPNTGFKKILGFPPDMLHRHKAVFYDDREYKFTQVLLLGIDRDLLLLMALLHSVLNFAFTNTIVSLLMVWTLDRLLCWVRSHWGQINLSTKTMVDDRFLL